MKMTRLEDILVEINGRAIYLAMWRGDQKEVEADVKDREVEKAIVSQLKVIIGLS